MISRTQIYILGSILVIALCLSCPVASYDDEYYYDDYEDFPEDIQFRPNPTTTTIATTTIATTTTTSRTTSTKAPKSTTTSEIIDIAEIIEPIAEDNFDQSLNEKKIEIVKKPFDNNVNSDVVYDDVQYDEETYDEGDYEQYEDEYEEENKIKSDTQDVENNDEDENKNEEITKESSENQNDNDAEETPVEQSKVHDGKKNNLAKASQVRDDDAIKSEKFKFRLDMVYIIVPIASIVLVALFVGTFIIIAKKTSVFKRKTQAPAPAEEPRKQIYQSVAQQEHIA